MNNGTEKASTLRPASTPVARFHPKAAFDKASALLKAGDVAGALAVELLPSDRDVIEKRIGANK